MNVRALIAAGGLTLAIAFAPASRAQVLLQEDFTGATSNNQWFFFNGACLTAGTSKSTTSPGYIPACTSVLTSYYNLQNDKDTYLSGGASGYLGSTTAPSSPSGQQPDPPGPPGSGALRFTNGSPYGHFERGAIVSASTPFPTGDGVQVTFKTITYLGDSGGAGGDGADGISFFLLDGCMPIAGGDPNSSSGVSSSCPKNPIYTGQTFPAIGATGGSLAYSCSNQNAPYDGLVGAYLGLGIDEFGNFLNGYKNSLSESGSSSTSTYGDNTATGGLYQPGRIGLRGAGSVSWKALTTAYGTNLGSSSPYYPATLGSSQQQSAVQNTCATGLLYNYSDPDHPVSVGPATLANTANTAKILDYAAIGSTQNGSAIGYNVLTSFKIASESATTRSAAKPIVYSLRITQDGLLSLTYSYNGGTPVPVIKGQSISATNGPLPQSFRFGFAGSTGGDTNVHEIICFRATPAETANGSGSVNVFQDPTLKTGAELFLASYFPNSWAGQVTATPINFNTVTNTLVLASTPTWDASCVLTGGACASTGATSGTAEAPANRVMITWNGTTGIPFEWASLTAAEQATLDVGDTTQTANRLNYLRGDRTNEINSSGVGLFRARDRVLGDIVDSSPAWIGPPGGPYTSMGSWVDAIYPTATPPENSGPTYLSYQQGKQGRLNVVYVGANDGFLHGFRAGTLDSNGNLVSTTQMPNDGYEVLAYMPGVVLNTIHPSSTSNGTTTVNTAADFSNTQYSHAYFVDATPATGDLFYANAWHTWVVGGLGAGGSAIYALDVTDPSIFTEANASKIVIGEWTAANLTCNNSTTCQQALGQTYGTPEVRRFHSGDWGVIFGNGFGALDASGNPGAAGIYVMLINHTTGAPTFYYLQATAAAKGALPNGIASPTSLDVDLDHTVDYIYAGDLLGNVWKFDVTSQTPANWGKTASSPLFTAPYTPAVAASGGNPAIASAPSPISTRLQVGTLKTIITTQGNLSTTVSTKPERVIINFGTGRGIPQSLTSPAQYANGPQYLYGIWDWDFGAANLPGTWNALSPNQQAVSLTAPQTIVGPGSGTNLQVQTITVATVGTGASAMSVRSMTKTPVCWKGDNACGSGQTMMGWYVQLPGTSEQVIFDPTYSPDGEFVVNTYVPSPSSILSCSSTQATGFSMGLDPLTGGGSATPFFNVGGVGYDGVQLNGTGTPSFISSGQPGDNNAEYLLTQTTGGNPAAPQKINRNAIITGQRINWIQRR